MSTTREQCQAAVIHFGNIINQSDTTSGNCAYVGIAGDPLPKGEYSPLFPTFDIETIDADSKWGPDIICDITKPNEDMLLRYDLVIIVQVIEHIKNLWDLPKALYQITKPHAHIIIDCPWNYPYHAEPPSFGDYWRITKDGFHALFEKQFNIIEVRSDSNNTSCLLQRK